MRRARRIQGEGARRSQGCLSERRRARASGIAGGRHRDGGCRWVDESDHQGRARAAVRYVHRCNRSRHFHKLRAVAPGKRFIEAPTAGKGATCRSCAHCPWMAMNELALLRDSLKHGTNEVLVDPENRPPRDDPAAENAGFQAAVGCVGAIGRLANRGQRPLLQRNRGFVGAIGRLANPYDCRRSSEISSRKSRIR